LEEELPAYPMTDKFKYLSEDKTKVSNRRFSGTRFYQLSDHRYGGLGYLY
jgi:hypothetical protein